MQLEKLKVRAPEILRMIPDEELAKLASDTKVDYCSKVLKGERMFYMLVYAMLCADRVSQRRLETVFSSAPFKTLFNFSIDMKVSHSSISSRLSKIDLLFFEKAYELIYDELSSLYTENEVRLMNLVRIDSSIVAETCNKLKEGFSVGKKPSSGESRRQAKYTVAYDGFGARLADVFFQPAYLSEDVAMPGVLMPLIKKDKDHMNLYVFDRGMSASANFSRISDEGAWFLGRIKTNRKMNVLRSLMTEGRDRNLSKLELVDDIVVHIFDDGGQEDMEHEYRVVKCRFKAPRDTERPKNKGKVKRVENEVYLITNHMGLTPQEIAEAYRRRWDIEVFFKFLKQELNFSHFLSTSENGIKVILYMTLITAMLIMIYKRKNEIGYSDAKFCFKLDMEEWIMELNYVIKGGDPTKCNPRFIIRTRIP